MHRLLPALLLTVAAASLQAGELSYAWKAGDLFRYDYYKAVSITQKDENGKLEERKTEFTGVMVLEVRTVTAAGATGTLRIDSPRVTLPQVRAFSAQSDAPEIQQEKNRSIGHAISGAIKVARWSVAIKRDGSFEILGRSPASTAEWFKETANSAGWRKKQIETVAKIIEQDLGFKPSGVDSDILLMLNSASQDAGETHALRPLRAVSSSKSGEKDKMQLSFTRSFKEGAGISYVVPNLESAKPVQIKPKSVSMHEGIAVFDTRLSMLDTLNEDYTATLDYTCGAQTLTQEVHVQYRLKRLAPAISKPE
ncbi:MAG TPA: hypothetical protein VEK08_23295 [Planctomycetota bacterium]|nr:hypothetical protein [Planctomycetota bacterium]